MSENNNLSIDEILQEAQEVLNSIGKKSEEAKEKIKSIDKPLDLDEDDVKTYNLKSNADKKPEKTIVKEPGREKIDSDKGKTGVFKNVSAKSGAVSA
ncbi:MAG: hypothetical protein LUG21_02150, partial [Clostridiales bacterium]|nr:hypothetical protein [Clostridiales bacterium]